MESLIVKIANKENLMLAWRKIENLFVPGDVWYDPLKMAAFKFRLKNNIEDISKALLSGCYKPQPLIPVPFPKSRKDQETEIPIRQSFIVDIADQLVWVAICNVIGVYLDTKMPAWSYGNRLYIRWWKDKDDKWQIGNYRNSVPSLYRNWNQSWPQMRKKITVSLKLMAGIGAHLSKEEKEILQKEGDVPETVASYARLKYLEQGYFESVLEENGEAKSLFWCGIDFKRFYPHVKMKEVIDIIIKELNKEEDFEFVSLLNDLSSFVLDNHEYVRRKDDLRIMGISYEQPVFDRLPTGLLVSGFLANVYMLEIDRKADKYLNKHRDVIHFRYVDDHVMVARSKEALKKWVDEYVSYVLNDTDEGLEINFEKVEPANALGNYGQQIEKIKLSLYKGCQEEILEKNGKLDPFYPTPLMTQTLQKVSLLSREKLPLLTATEFEMVFRDLQAMMVTDLPEQEISKQTRISFTCTMLSRLLLDGNVDYHQVHEVRKALLMQAKKGYLKDAPEESRRRISMLYRDLFEATAEEKNQFPEFDYGLYASLNDTIVKGNREAHYNAETIFFLLRRAIREVPEKVKVWVRSFNFAVCHYPAGIKHILVELNEMRRAPDKLHELSVLYLESMIEMLASQHIMSILIRLKRNDYSTTQEKLNDILSLQELTKVSFANEGFGFKKVTEMMMQNALLCYQSLYDSLEIIPIEHIPPINEWRYSDGTLLDSTFWKVWKIDSFHITYKDASITQELLNGNDGISTESPYIESYLFKVVSLTDGDKSLFEQLLPSKMSIDALSDEIRYACSMIGSAGEALGLKPQEINIPRDFISLRDWITKKEIEKQRALEDNENERIRDILSEAVYSEWMSVRLMLSIAKTVNNGLNASEDQWTPEMLNPATILIKNDNRLAVTWENRGDDRLFEVILSTDKIKGAEHYYTIPQLYDTLPYQNAVCYGLGLIFLHILTRRLYFPWIMNSPDYGFEWRTELNRLLNHGQVSSVNYQIVEECLTAWNRESVRIQRDLLEAQQLNLFKEDDLYFSFKIRGIDQLINRLEQSYEQMKRNLVSVPGNAYRQLLEISVL